MPRVANHQNRRVQGPERRGDSRQVRQLQRIPGDFRRSTWRSESGITRHRRANRRGPQRLSRSPTGKAASLAPRLQILHRDAGECVADAIPLPSGDERTCDRGGMQNTITVCDVPYNGPSAAGGAQRIVSGRTAASQRPGFQLRGTFPERVPYPPRARNALCDHVSCLERAMCR